MEDWQRQLVQTSAALQHAVAFERICKGYSADEKYRVFLKDGAERLLRVFAKAEWEQKQAEFAILDSLQARDIKASRPVEMGALEAGDACYMIVTYLAGEDASDVLGLLNEEQQYRIGWEAGKDLARMHAIPAPSDVADWKERCLAKHCRYVAAYEVCGYRIPQAERLLAFIERHADCLEGIPNRFLHDDFHVGNLIVHGDEYAGAIDFNRFDWGDPVHDFTKLAFFSSEISLPFSMGQLAGYHAETSAHSENFWLRYSLYTAMMVFSSVVWTLRVVPEKIGDMLLRVERICREHDDFSRLTPAWYSSAETKKELWHLP